jgi:hypothetical protein
MGCGGCDGARQAAGIITLFKGEIDVKYIALRPEQLIFDSEEAAVEYYKRPKVMSEEDRIINAQRYMSGEEETKVLICTVDCVRVLTPSVATSPGGDQHFVDFETAEAERRAASQAIRHKDFGYVGAEDYRSNTQGLVSGGKLAKAKLS